MESRSGPYTLGFERQLHKPSRHLQRHSVGDGVVHEGCVELVVLVVADDGAGQRVEAEQVRQRPLCAPRTRILRAQALIVGFRDCNSV